jgi:hypothetical protein
MGPERDHRRLFYCMVCQRKTIMLRTCINHALACSQSNVSYCQETQAQRLSKPYLGVNERMFRMGKFKIYNKGIRIIAERKL